MRERLEGVCAAGLRAPQLPARERRVRTIDGKGQRGDAGGAPAEHRAPTGMVFSRSGSANYTGVIPRVLPTKTLTPRASSSIGRAADF